jgi:peptidoglycan/LPS O-acetylase OafA/YrhL
MTATPLSNTRSLAYRPDIDGLRALAVMAVVIYHVFPNWLPGGFVGVDVFFVISGYLISSIIFKQQKQQEFKLSIFYLHRVWRLFPALLLVLISTLMYGFFRLQPDELTQLSKHAFGSAGFISNFIFLKESGYFDNAAEAKPLLHMWSLSIEEQFYLLWPITILFIKRLRLHFGLVALLLFVFSFCLCLYQVRIDPINAFYLPYTRFWELLAGALLALYKQSRYGTASGRYSANIQSMTGVALFFFSVLSFSKAITFPGWWALVPVIGSVLIIAAGEGAIINRTIFKLGVLVRLGLISYPLYLWHVPLLAYFNIESGHSMSIAARVGIVLIAALLAQVTYLGLERPLRRFHENSRATIILIGAMLAFTVLAGAAFAYLQKQGQEGHSSIQSLLSPSQNDFYLFYADTPRGRWTQVFESKFRHDCNFFMVEQFWTGEPTRQPKDAISKSCYERRPDLKHAVLVWGDSHAQMLNSGLTNNLPADWQVLQVASSGCVPSMTYAKESKTDYCAHSNWFAIETIKAAHPDVVILAQHDFHAAEALNALSSALVKLGVKKVLIIGPATRWRDDLPKLFTRVLWKEQPERTMTGIDVDMIRKNDNLKRLITQNAQIQYVDMQKVFCDARGCLTYLLADGVKRLVSWDRGHLTEDASNYFANALLIREILK